MSSCSRLTAILALASLAATLSGVAETAAQERCSGTLCDFYYGTPSSFDDKPKPTAPPTPVIVPRGTVLGMFSDGNAANGTSATASGPNAPARRPMVGVGGGGIAALARGEKVDRCTGTLCDFYYGGPPPEQVNQAATAAPTAAAPQIAAEAAAEPETEAPAAHGFEARPEPPHCVAKSKDPWGCYR